MPDTLTAPAPTAAPAAPSAPAPAPAPSSIPSNDDISSIASAFDKYDAAAPGSDDDTPPAKPEKPSKPDPTKKPESAKPAEPAPKPAADKPDPAKPADGKSPTPPSDVAAGTPAQLRKQYEKTKADLDARNAAYADLEKRIQEAEEKGKNTDALQARLDAMEKTIKEKEAELSAARFEASSDFKDKFEKPYQRAWAKTKAYVDSLQKPDGTPARFESDFAEVLRSPNATAPAKARELFGDDHAHEILAQRRRLIDMEEDAQEAIRGERDNWETNRKQREETQRLEQLKRAKQTEEMRALQQKIIEEIGQSVPGYSDPVGENADEEAATLRKEQYQLLDTKPETFQDYAKLQANMRHRFAAFPVLQLQNQRLQAKIEELQKALDESKPNQPMPGGARKPGGAPVEKPDTGFDPDELVATLRAAK